MEAVDWVRVAETCRKFPGATWQVTYLNGELEQGNITHLPAGEPMGWSEGAVFHLVLEEPASKGPGEARRVSQVASCVRTSGLPRE